MLNDGDPHAYLLEIADFVRKQIKRMFDLVDQQLKNQRSREARHDTTAHDAEKEATEKLVKDKRQASEVRVMKARASLLKSVKTTSQLALKSKA